jgi:hypothetical protein
MVINIFHVATQGVQPTVNTHSIATHGFSFRSAVGEAFVYVVEGIKAAACYISVIANNTTVTNVMNYCKSLVLRNDAGAVNLSPTVAIDILDEAPTMIYETTIAADCVPSIFSNTTGINITLNSILIGSTENTCKIATDSELCSAEIDSNETLIGMKSNTCSITTKYWSGYGG